MDNFIFNEYTKRLLNGEVNSSQIWNFLPVNRKFVETFENCSSLNFKQFRTTADIGCYSADGLTEPRKKYIYNEYNDTYELNSFYDVVNNLSGLVTATYSQIKYKKNSDTTNKPLYIDNNVSEEELKNLYNIELNEVQKSYKNDGFYYVTKASELNWLSNRCEKNNTFNICLGDNIVEENLYSPIGNYENPFQGIFDGAGYVFSSCNINVDKDINGVIGVLGNNGVVKNIRIQDMTFSSDNLLTTSYAKKYNNDVIVGFVAKNYGQVYDVSSIGDNYIYGLSPAIYSTYNKTDEKGDEDNLKILTRCAYLIDQSDYRIRRDYNSFQDKTFSNYMETLPTPSEAGEMYEIKSLILSSNGNSIELNNDDYLLISYDVSYGHDNTNCPVHLNDWKNGIVNISNRNNYSDLFKTIKNYNTIYSHYRGDYRISTFSENSNNITYNNIADKFKTNNYYYYCENEILDLRYVHIKDNYSFDKENGKFIIEIDKSSYNPISDNEVNNINKITDKIFNHSNNLYYINDGGLINNEICIDNSNNINPYYGYFNTYTNNSNYCESFSPSLKFTYLVSPIVGSNYNIISGCLNNSNIYFGANKYKNYNPFAGEYGCIAGYNEGYVINNSSNSNIKDFTKASYDFKVFPKFTINSITNTHYDIVSSVYDKNLNLKNSLIYGNIVGRNNLYTNSSNISKNVSNLLIENSNNFDTNYFRPSTLIGSMYLNTCLSSVSCYNSVVKNNSSYIDSKNNNVSSTFAFNELYMCLDEFPNTNHYSKSIPQEHDTEYVETSGSIIQKQNNEINEIIKKCNNNSNNGKAYNNFKVVIPNPSYISHYNTYISPNDYLKNCKYENKKNTSYTVNIQTMSYNLEDIYTIDKGFDISRLMIKEDYSGTLLRPLSAKVEFDYDNTNFKIVESENNLYWGTSSDPNAELLYKNELTGDVINSKDFAGVIIYDNDGNLIGYENNYKTNVLYNTYSMKYKDNIIMEIQ